jgi:hypothetical protein
MGPSPQRRSWTHSGACSRCTSSLASQASPQTNRARSLSPLLSRFRPSVSTRARCACFSRKCSGSVALPPSNLAATARPDPAQSSCRPHGPPASARVRIRSYAGASAGRIATTGSSPLGSSGRRRREARPMRVTTLCATSEENVSRESPAQAPNTARPSPPTRRETPTFARPLPTPSIAPALRAARARRGPRTRFPTPRRGL